MEEEENKETNPLDALNELEPQNIKNYAALDAISQEFSSCDKVYKSNLGHPKHDKLPIFMGVDSKKGEYFFSMGSADPFVLNKTQFLYLGTAISKLVESIMEDVNHVSPTDLPKLVAKELSAVGGLSIGSGTNMSSQSEIEDLLKSDEIKTDKSGDSNKVDFKGTPHSMSDKVKDLLSKLMKGKDIEKEIEDLKSTPEIEDALEDGNMPEELTEVMDKMKKQAEDINSVMESLTPEEQEAFRKEMELEKEKKIHEKAKAFEKELLGEIKKEDDIEYNYAYFRDFYKKNGLAMCKEELCKIPATQRGEIIQKIMDEFKTNKSNA